MKNNVVTFLHHFHNIFFLKEARIDVIRAFLLLLFSLFLHKKRWFNDHPQDVFRQVISSPLLRARSTYFSYYYIIASFEKWQNKYAR